MGYTSTQSRTSQPKDFPWSSKINGSLHGSGDLLDVFSVAERQQVTTSYRSGKRATLEGSQEESNEEQLLSGGKAFQTYEKLSTADSLRPRDSADTGHPFSTVNRRVEADGPYEVTNVVSGTQYHGSSYLKIYRSGSSWAADARWPAVPSWSYDYYGAEAIKRTKPTNPSTGLFVALTELRREGLPHLSGSQLLDKQRPASFGGEYLNVEFGWKPLISSVVETMHAVDNAKAIIRQHMRNSGGHVRRSYTFPVVRKTTLERPFSLNGGKVEYCASTTGISPWEGTTSLAATGTFTQVLEETERIKFSGAYTYYVPDGKGILQRLDRYMQSAEKLVGLEANPEAIWNVLPWSWLVDWNFSMGTFLSNLESFQSDGLLLRYGYIQRHYWARRTKTVTRPVLKGRKGAEYQIRFITESKERVRADPFGFTLKPGVYTDRQWNILGALGLSRGPKSLF